MGFEVAAATAEEATRGGDVLRGRRRERDRELEAKEKESEAEATKGENKATLTRNRLTKFLTVKTQDTRRVRRVSLLTRRTPLLQMLAVRARLPALGGTIFERSVDRGPFLGKAS
jgi:hypothetical protein